MKTVFRYFLFLAIGLTVCTSAYAQTRDTRTENKRTADTSDVGGEHEVGWVRSHPADNWYFMVNGGGQLYNGYQDNLGPFKDRLTGMVEAYMGRWVFPMVGFRLGGGWGRSHGFVSVADHDAYPLAHGFGESEGLSNEALGGYYWSYADDNSLYIQKWDHLYAGGDIMVNFSLFHNGQNYNAERKWHNLGYAGVYIHHGLNEDHPQVPRSSDDNWAAEGRVGYVGKFCINKHWNLFLDARFSVFEGRFDREYCEDVEKFPQDCMFSLHGGVCYDLNFRSEGKRSQYFVEQGLMTKNDGSAPKYINYVQVEEIEQIRIIDTIVKYTTVYADDIDTKHLVDSLQRVLDSLLRIQKASADDQPLDSIFLKNLLPYEMVFFALDQWDILPSEEMKIAKMAKIIQAYPNEKFLLTGSADSKTGTVKRNIFLSHNRADVVYNKLISEYGINPDQLEREYLGGIMDYDPFVLNRTTVIIMDHPTVRKAFEAMKSQRKAGGGVTEF